MRFADRIPAVYAEFVLAEHSNSQGVEADENCLGLLKHFYSLVPMSMEANKPIFLLKPGDGAIGAHGQAVRKAYLDFQHLTKKIIERCEIEQSVGI